MSLHNLIAFFFRITDSIPLYGCIMIWGFPSGASGKEPTCQCRRLRDPFLGQEDPLKEGMATHSSVLAWRIPRTEEPGGLQSMGSHRVRHDWSSLAHVHHSLFFISPVEWPLVCLQILTFVNTAVINICRQIFVWTEIFSLFRFIPIPETLLLSSCCMVW